MSSGRRTYPKAEEAEQSDGVAAEPPAQLAFLWFLRVWHSLRSDGIQGEGVQSGCGLNSRSAGEDGQVEDPQAVVDGLPGASMYPGRSNSRM